MPTPKVTELLPVAMTSHFGLGEVKNSQIRFANEVQSDGDARMSSNGRVVTYDAEIIKDECKC